MEKGQIVQIRIEDQTSEGQGLGRNNGFAVFVKGAVVGDIVEAELTKVKKSYAFGRLVKIVESSPNRIESLCPQANECGGCPYANLDYGMQLSVKENQVKNALIRLGGIENPQVNRIKAMDHPFHYRNKASMPISTGGIITKKGGIVESVSDPMVGFFKKKTHLVIDCSDCMLQSAPAMAVAEVLRRFMKEDNITGYDPKWEKGLMRHLVVKTAYGTGEVMVILVINGKGIPNASKLIEMLDDAIYNLPPTKDGMEFNLESVIVNINKKKTSKIMGEEWITIAGKPTITEVVGDLTFEISPLSFYQVNTEEMKVLYDKAIEYAALKGGETVLDLYCGVGTIGLFAAKAGAGKVIGIESVKGAVIDANRNAVINGIVNARYVCGKAEFELPKMMGMVKPAELTQKEADQENPNNIQIKSADVVILDPPRSGCEKNLLKAVIKAEPTRIVYVSCNPATLARDVHFLCCCGYVFEEATPVDMFPWTSHVETVALMSRKDK